MHAVGFLKRFPWFIPTLIFSILVIAGARMHPLWGDEAETALFARNILKYGFPNGWDGVNILGYRNGIYLNEHLINYSNPWLQYYFSTISFMLFGESSFTARFPFVILSIVSIPLFYYLTLAILKKKEIATLATCILSLSVPYVLFSYQARYYPLNVFFGLLFFYGLVRLEKTSDKKFFFISFLGAVFYLFSHPVSSGIFFLAVSGYFIVLRPKGSKSSILIKNVFAVLIAAFVVFLPFLVWLTPYKERATFSFLNPASIISSIVSNMFEMVVYFQDHNVFPILFITLVLLIVFQKRSKIISRSFIGLITLIMLYILVTSIVQTFVQSETPFTTVRHNILLFPFLIMLVSATLVNLKYISHKFFWFITPIFLFTTLFSFQIPPRIFLYDFYNEMHNPYKTPTEAVAQYLTDHAQSGDTAYVNLDRNIDPLLFELKNKIRFVNRVNKSNKRLFPKNEIILPSYIYAFRGSPNWVILFSKRPYTASYWNFDMLPLPSGIDLVNNYEEIVLPVFFSDLSRPEIELHSFYEIKPDYQDQVFIYKRKIENE